MKSHVEIACNNNNMRNPSLHYISRGYATPPYIIFRGVTHVVIVACNFHMGFHHFLHMYTSCVWSYHNQLFTVHHSDYYSLVSLVFGPIITTSFNILMKFFTLVHAVTQGLRARNNNNMHNPKLSIYAAKQVVRACNNNNMRNPSLHPLISVTHVIIVACPHSLFYCIYTTLVSLLFGTVIPTSFNIFNVNVFIHFTFGTDIPTS